MSKDPAAAAKARKAESREEGVIRVKIGGGTGGGGGGFKKGGFKNAFGGGVAEVGGRDGVFFGDEVDDRVGVEVKREKGDEGMGMVGAGRGEGDVESETDEDEYYDPSRPTGCWEGCGGR